MTFAAPWWLALGVVVLALAVGYLIAQRLRRRDTMRFANLELLDRVAPKRPGWIRHVPTALVLIGLALLTVAMAAPTAEAKVPRNRAVVVLAIDVSLSMEAVDVPPNRLVAAQEAAKQFVADLTPGVNLGVLEFAGVPTVLVSPTTDRAPALSAIDGLKLDEGTATGEALYAALQTVDVYSKAYGGTEEKPPARIVLMTDGKRTVGRTEQSAAEAAALAKVPVSVVAFGTPDASIEVNGQRQPVPLDEAGMKDIARLSGGDFHTAATKEELTKVYSQLGEQIGYELQPKDVSRPWMIAGSIAVMVGAAGALVVGRRIP